MAVGTPADGDCAAAPRSAEEAAPALPSRRKGVLITLFGIVWVSPDSMLLRLAELEHPRASCVVLYKYLFKLLATSVGLVLVVYGGPRGYLARARAGGWHFWAAATLEGVSELLFSLGTLHTNAANNLVLVSLNPLWCALLSIAWFQEWPQRHTRVALLVGVGSVALIFWGTSDETPSGRESVLGDTIGLCNGLVLALYLTVCRHAQTERPLATLVPASVPGSVISVALGVVLAQGRVGEECWPASGAAGLVYSALNGALFMPVALACFAVGPKYILSSEVGLIMLLEVVLGPLLVWIATRETPSPWTVAGGAILVATLAGNELMSMRREAAAPAAAAGGEGPCAAGAAEVLPGEDPCAATAAASTRRGAAAPAASADVLVGEGPRAAAEPRGPTAHGGAALGAAAGVPRAAGCCAWLMGRASV